MVHANLVANPGVIVNLMATINYQNYWKSIVVNLGDVRHLGANLAAGFKCQNH